MDAGDLFDQVDFSSEVCPANGGGARHGVAVKLRLQPQSIQDLDDPLRRNLNPKDGFDSGEPQGHGRSGSDGAHHGWGRGLAARDRKDQLQETFGGNRDLSVGDLTFKSVRRVTGNAMPAAGSSNGTWGEGCCLQQEVGGVLVDAGSGPTFDTSECDGLGDICDDQILG